MTFGFTVDVTLEQRTMDLSQEIGMIRKGERILIWISIGVLLVYNLLLTDCVHKLAHLVQAHQNWVEWTLKGIR